MNTISNKRMMSLLISVILLLVSLYLFSGYVRPAFLSVREARSEVAVSRGFLDGQRAAQEAFKSLAVEVNNAASIQGLLATALPKGEDLPQSVHQIQSLARLSGLQLENLAVTKPVGQTNNKITSLIKEVRTMEVSFRVVGDYAGLKRFLEVVENNIKLMDVMKLEIKNDRAGGLLTFDIVVNMYYQG